MDLRILCQIELHRPQCNALPRARILLADLKDEELFLQHPISPNGHPDLFAGMREVPCDFMVLYCFLRGAPSGFGAI